MTSPDRLDPKLVGQRLQRGAAQFRFMDAACARRAMQGRLQSDGAIVEAGADEPFAVAVARRLEVLRALERRRRMLRTALAPPSSQ